MKKEEQIDHNLKIIAGSSFLVFIGLVLSKLFSYLYRIIIARQFGAEFYGIFSLATIIAGWFITLAGLGLSEGIIRYLVIYQANKQPQKSYFIFKYIRKVTVLSSLLMGFVLWIFASWISINLFKNTDLIIFLKWFSLTVPMMALCHLYLSSLRALKQIGWYSFILNILQNLIKVAIILFLLALGIKTESIIFSYFAAILGMLVCSWIVFNKTNNFILNKNKPLKSTAKAVIREKIWSYSLPLLFFNITYLLFYWMDSLFLGYYRGVEAVGWYNAAVPIALLLAVAPELFIQIFLPIITEAYAKGKGEVVQELSKQVAKWIFIINLPIFITMVIAPKYILLILFGKEFVVASVSLRILAFGSLISSLLAVSQQIAYARGKSSIFLKSMICAVILNIILNIWLIPRTSIFNMDNSSGLVGASLATAASLILLNLIFTFFLNDGPVNNLPFRKKMILVLLSGIIPAIFFYLYMSYVKINLINFMLGGLIFGLIYLFLLFIFRALDKYDLSILKIILNKIFRKR